MDILNRHGSVLSATVEMVVVPPEVKQVLTAESNSSSIEAVNSCGGVKALVIVLLLLLGLDVGERREAVTV